MSSLLLHEARLAGHLLGGDGVKSTKIVEGGIPLWLKGLNVSDNDGNKGDRFIKHTTWNVRQKGHWFF